MSFNHALAHFKKVDPVLYSAGVKYSPIPDLTESKSEDYFEQLCESIVSQQLSIRVADVIWQRVLDLFPKRKITPQRVLDTKHELLRKCGLSNAKATYIRDLAAKTVDGTLQFEKFVVQNENEIAKELIKVKGIGPWTAEMFLMFTMGRPDIFSAGDLGLKNAMAKLSGLKSPSTWSPYRTYACRILWKTITK